MRKWRGLQNSSRIKMGLFLLFVMGCPYFITMQISGRADTKMIPLLENGTGNGTESNGMVLIIEGREESELSLEEYIMGVIPAYLSGEDAEADKAMAVLIRTYLYYQIQEKKSEKLLAEELSLTYLSAEERKILWGEFFSEEYQRVQKAVSDTVGEVLFVGEGKEKQVIYPYFHTLSAGGTRGRADASYLKEAVCEADRTADGFLTFLVFGREETLDKLAVLGYLSTEADFSLIRCEYDRGLYVKTVFLGDWSVSSEDFQKLFGLRSAAFEIEEYHEGIRILTRGCGSGYGASLNMIRMLALQGKSYQEILSVFFEAELGNFQISE